MYHQITGDFFLRHAKRCPGNFQNDTTRETSDDVQRYFAKRSSCCLQEVYAGSKDLLRSENMLYIVVCDCDEFQNGSIIKWLRQSSWLPRRHLHFLHPIHISQKSTTELLTKPIVNAVGLNWMLQTRCTERHWVNIAASCLVG